jgi:hypothetical protein
VTVPRPAVRAWWLTAGLLIAAFLARAPLYLSVFPPFEGWDEYQHLAYIVHLDEAGTIPAYESRLPLALRPLVLAMPHSLSGSEQLHEWGALSYADYWNTAPAASRSVTSSPRLYQSQQPPLAYVMDLPVWRALKPRPLDAIFVMRAINVLLVAGSLVLFAAALTRLVPAWWPRVMVLALVCLHPLFFQNVARVANDGLAVATGIAGISLLLLADGRTLLTRGVLAAACLAASVWSKQTSLTLLPALVLGLPLIGWSHGVPGGRLWRVTGITCAVLLLLLGPSWVWNYLRVGTILTTQDSVELAARGSTLSALGTSFATMAWQPAIDFLFGPGKAWVGGWTFLPVQSTLDVLYRWYWSLLLAGAAIGGLFALWRRARPDDAAPLAVCATVVICTVLGMTYHAVLSHAVYGRVMTTPWYFMTALPFLFVLAVRGLETIDRRLATASAAALAVLFVAIDLYGTWVQMPAAYASTTNATLQWSRLSKIHPAFLSGELRWWFLALQLGALALVVGSLAIARRRPGGLKTALY